MAEALIDGTGSGYLVGVTSSNRLLVETEGISSMTGSSSFNYVSSGTGWIEQSYLQNTTGSVQITNSELTINGGVYSTEEYKTVISYSGAVQEYIGKAIPGTNKGSGAWQIQKLSYDGYNVTDIEFADSSTSFNKIWNNRSTFTYG